MESRTNSLFSSAAPSASVDKNSNEGIDTLETIPAAVPVVLTEPPIEEQLAWHTLWPESHKLYGHGNELFSLCCDHEGKLVASSCKVYHILIHHAVIELGHTVLYMDVSAQLSTDCVLKE